MRKSLRDYRINDFLWNPRHQGPFDWLVYTESTADQQSHRSRVILEQQLQRAVEAIDSAFSTATGEHVD